VGGAAPVATVPSASPAPGPSPHPLARGRGTAAKPLRIYPFGVSRNRLEQTITSLAVPATITRDLREADVVMTLKNYYRRRPQQLEEAEALGKPVYVLRTNTGTQMETVLAGIFGEPRLPAPFVPAAPDGAGDEDVPDGVTSALFEAEEAVTAVMDSDRPIELAPQTAYIRRLQHQVAERYNLGSRSRGKEPYRRVEIMPR
jgi:hypothetical protein